jgi:hypothetical protein
MSFYTVVVDGAVIATHQDVDGDDAARRRAVAAADALASSGETVEVYRNEVAGEIGRPGPELVHTARPGP